MPRPIVLSAASRLPAAFIKEAELLKTLSITIPVYNTESYLRRCLDSVLLEEALDDLELLIVNDGSKDGSPDLIREYAARYPQTIVFIDKENGGHGSTVNAGLKAATGRYFRVLDSDDWVDSPEFLKYLDALKHCDEDIVVTPYTMEYVFDGRQLAYAYKWLDHNVTIPIEDLHYDGSDQYFTIHSSTVKTEVLRESGMQLFEKCFYVDMQYILYPIPWFKTVRVLDNPVYRYFIGRPEQSMSQESMMRNYPQHQKVLTWMIDYYGQFSDKMLPNVSDYMARIVRFTYYTHLDLLCKKMKNKRLARRTIRELDAHVRQVSPHLYEMLAAYPYLAASRKLGFLNVSFLDPLFTAFVELRQKLKNR